ncbi:RagB/SusD family nutrient uptake outer membrane protein [Pedobacter endophyticus]|uniref:RagB/SusD family nutrient uptake outer membrane protein n=1 Tax=Pedobacter endophyticus TaxID=2789740 RepID=A0A7S9L136_9SPHI|nr:RagB/SusD family nutrient uptake outer membrane protein [Pedobacter endophyticus]QPH40554.1 RagB/SusD family nutrient uptake outer membrane protein [Pedobacter endophyticus]
MKNSIIYLFIALTAAMMFSCKKYLDVKSDAKIVTPSSLDDIQALLDDSPIMNTRTTPGFSETSADDYFLPPASYNAQAVNGQRFYQWLPVDVRYGNDWNYAYQAIYNCNIALELLDKIKRTTVNAASWDNVKGAALFFRSFYFLLLSADYARVYNEATADSDPGILLRTSSDFNLKEKRATVRECYQRITADLEMSSGLLPDFAVHPMRPSRAAACALLARAYLYMGNYEAGLKWSTQSLQINGKLMDYNNDPGVLSLAANVTFRKYNSETLFYAEMSPPFNIHATSRARIDSVLYASYRANDLRKTAYFKTVSGYQQYKGSYAESASIFFSGIANDEVYLTRAECNAFLGNLSPAMADLNALVKSRWKSGVAFVPLTASDRADALAKIRLERRKSLLMRGLRWIDLKRYNREGGNILISRTIDGKIVSLQPNASYYALPIPVDIIEQAGIEQN